jgi:hypothetical protein
MVKKGSAHHHHHHLRLRLRQRQRLRLRMFSASLVPIFIKCVLTIGKCRFSPA